MLQPAFYLRSRRQCKLRPVHAQELSIKLLEEDPEKNADYLQVGLGACVNSAVGVQFWSGN